MKKYQRFELLIYARLNFRHFKKSTAQKKDAVVYVKEMPFLTMEGTQDWTCGVEPPLIRFKLELGVFFVKTKIMLLDSF